MTENEVLAAIYRLNCDPGVHAILLQLPLDSDSHIDCQTCTNAIAVDKVLSSWECTAVALIGCTDYLRSVESTDT